MPSVEFEDGYYWVRCPADGQRFIALRERPHWYTIGIEHPIDETLDCDDILCPVAEPAPH